MIIPFNHVKLVKNIIPYEGVVKLWNLNFNVEIPPLIKLIFLSTILHG